MRGLFRPAGTDAPDALAPTSWLDTGDLGYLLNGAIVITGRAKDLIILNGRNTWPQDLDMGFAEDAVAELRRGDVAAISVTDPHKEDQEADRGILVQCRSSDPEAREKLKRDVAAVLQQAMAVESTVVLVLPHGLLQILLGQAQPRQGARPTTFRASTVSADAAVSA